MNNMYADRNGKLIDNKENTAIGQAGKLIKRQNATKEKSASIVNYYTNRQQKIDTGEGVYIER
ncbi:hypothetical protein D3Z36_07730 [Lachnospiraceae bacterium]|nr:hypothetical protein [Lachnospiraceae bacterium]